MDGMRTMSYNVGGDATYVPLGGGLCTNCGNLKTYTPPASKTKLRDAKATLAYGDGDVEGYLYSDSITFGAAANPVS